MIKYNRFTGSIYYKHNSSINRPQKSRNDQKYPLDNPNDLCYNTLALKECDLNIAE